MNIEYDDSVRPTVTAVSWHPLLIGGRTPPHLVPEWQPPPTVLDTAPAPNSGCLHRCCQCCGGTGIRQDGLGPCIHMMSCPCPMCSPRC